MEGFRAPVHKRNLRGFLATILVILSLTASAQRVTAYIDARNAVLGSDVNPPALNFKISISDQVNYSIFRFGMEYESFPHINYQKWTWAKIDLQLPVNQHIDILPGVSASQIYHETSYSRDAMSYAFYAEALYYLSDRVGLSVQLCRERSSDIEQLWRDSGYLGISYIWGRN